MTERQRIQRLNFAKDHKNWTVEQWEDVIFTDESCVQSSQNGTAIVYRPKNMRYDPKYVKKTTRSGRFSIPVWSCMSAKGVSDLHQIDGTLTSDVYVEEILDTILLPLAQNDWYPDGCFFLQQVFKFSFFNKESFLNEHSRGFDCLYLSKICAISNYQSKTSSLETCII